MKLTVEMEIDNAAFVMTNEAAWIIRNLSHHLLGIDWFGVIVLGGPLIDNNGNTVGEWRVENENKS